MKEEVLVLVLLLVLALVLVLVLVLVLELVGAGGHLAECTPREDPSGRDRYDVDPPLRLHLRTVLW